MFRHFLVGGVTTAFAILLTPATSAQSVVRNSSTPPGLILPSVTVKPGATLLYLSGQVPDPIETSRDKPAAKLTTADLGDTRTQTISTLNKIKAILAKHGFALNDVIKLTVYLVGDPSRGGRMDFEGMNAGFRQFFGTRENPDTVVRSTVQVAGLASPAYLVEIEAAAAR